MKRTPLNRVNKDRAKENRLYLKLAEWYLAEHRDCERCIIQRASEVHHRAGRIGEWLTYVPFFMAVCRPCHRWIEDNRKAAETKGWIIRIRKTFKDFIHEQESILP